MNHLVARSVLRRLIGNRACDRYTSTSSTAVAVAVSSVRPFDEVVAAMWGGQKFGFIGGAKWWRPLSTATERTKAVAEKDHKGSEVTEKDRKGSAVAEKEEEGGGVMVSSYWGVSRPKIVREDGTEWPWNCFMPWETYQADLSIDLSKHHTPKTFLDKIAFRTVKLLRIPTDMFFQGIR